MKLVFLILSISTFVLAQYSFTDGEFIYRLDNSGGFQRYTLSPLALNASGSTDGGFFTSAITSIQINENGTLAAVLTTYDYENSIQPSLRILDIQTLTQNQSTSLPYPSDENFYSDVFFHGDNVYALSQGNSLLKFDTANISTYTVILNTTDLYGPVFVLGDIVYFAVTPVIGYDLVNETTVSSINVTGNILYGDISGFYTYDVSPINGSYYETYTLHHTDFDGNARNSVEVGTDFTPQECTGGGDCHRGLALSFYVDTYASNVTFHVVRGDYEFLHSPEIEYLGSYAEPDLNNSGIPRNITGTNTYSAYSACGERSLYYLLPINYSLVYEAYEYDENCTLVYHQLASFDLISGNYTTFDLLNQTNTTTDAPTSTLAPSTTAPTFMPFISRIEVPARRDHQTLASIIKKKIVK
jgi:hypothetical protein